MKTVSLILLVIFAASLQAFVQAQDGGNPNIIGDQRRLEELTILLMSAVERKDKAELERLVGPGFTLSAPGEEEVTVRAEWIANSISMDWSDFKYHNIRVEVYGDTAVVTSRLDFRVSGGKIPIPAYSDAQIIDVWQRQNGEWQIAARHLGAYSMSRRFNLIGGFFAGLLLCFLIWQGLRLSGRLQRGTAER
jgi:hypothetical protein